MGDGGQRLDDDVALVARLEGWFDGEVRRARADLSMPAKSVVAGHPVPRADRRSRMTSLLAPLIVAVVVVGGTIAAGAALQRDPPSPPVGDASASPKPAASEAPELTKVDITGWYWDGVPASINGEEVRRPSQVTRSEPGTSGTILVGGWVWSSGVLCIAPPSCAPPELRESRDGGPSIPLIAPDVLEHRDVIAVYRRHAVGLRLIWSADPAAFIADRSPDGIPGHLDGVEVHPVSAVKSVLDRTPDDRAILIAGWLGGIPLRCAAPPPGRDEHPLLPWCNGNRIGDEPRQALGSGDRSTPLVIEGASPPPGRVVLRVHHHDARSSSCPRADRHWCEATIVVEAVVWSGDEWTETAPLAIADVVERLGSTGLDRADLIRNVITGAPPDGAFGCRLDFPPEMWTPLFEDSADGSPIGRILIFASVADRERVGANLRPDGFIGRAPDGSSCITMSDSATATEWIAVDNVIVALPHRHDEDATELRHRIDAVEAALRGE